MSPAHLSPVVLKHHEAGLWVSSAGAGGGSTASRPTAGTPRVQPAQPAHTGPSERQVKSYKNSTAREGVPVKRSKNRHNIRQGKLEREEKEKILWEGEGGEGGEREGISKQREGGEGGQLQMRCHCQSE